VTESEPGEALPDFAPAEEVIKAIQADIRHGGDQAFYDRLNDYIQLPHKRRFNPIGSYYETAFHELAHWSESRLSWDSDAHGYPMNELVAEMSASFLATELGVPQGESLENHAAYLRSWLQAMKGDASFIFKASTQASKVADFLLSHVAHEATQPEPVLANEGGTL
jgi:antirestriction protein ArdC